MTATRKSAKGLDTKTLVAGIIGVSPIPIIGEIGLSYFMYEILDGAGQKAIPPIAGIPAALLTRLAMYHEFYLPLYEKIFN